MAAAPRNRPSRTSPKSPGGIPMLRMLLAAPIAAFVVTAAAPVAAADAELAKAVAGPQRSAANKARDPARHPAETLTFWGLKPKQTVIELSPGGGYWTEILAP